MEADVRNVFTNPRVKPLQFAQNFTPHSTRATKIFTWNPWPGQVKSKLIALYIPLMVQKSQTTWESAKTLVKKGRTYQPQLVSCSRISLHHQLCMVPAASLSRKTTTFEFFSAKPTNDMALPLKTYTVYLFQGEGPRPQDFPPSSRPGILKVESGMVPSEVSSAVSPSPLQGIEGTPAVWARMPAAILSPKTDLQKNQEELVGVNGPIHPAFR